MITGGAGSIGLATARAFIDEGARVLLVDLDEAQLRSAAESLESDAVSWAVADVTSSEQVQAAVNAALELFGRLDIAFANAGVFGVVAPITEYPTEIFERVLAVNVLGSFLVAKHALAVMGRGEA